MLTLMIFFLTATLIYLQLKLNEYLTREHIRDWYLFHWIVNHHICSKSAISSKS